jgi:hypothetical protein
MLFEEMRVRPPIILSADDYERLSALANAGKKRMPDLAADLVEEIGRAHVLAKGSQSVSSAGARRLHEQRGAISRRHDRQNPGSKAGVSDRS